MLNTNVNAEVTRNKKGNLTVSLPDGTEIFVPREVSWAGNAERAVVGTTVRVTYSSEGAVRGGKLPVARSVEELVSPGPKKKCQEQNSHCIERRQAPGRRQEVLVTDVIGEVVWFNRIKKFGFLRLRPEEKRPDVFVHISAIEANNDFGGTLEKGARLRFDIEQDPKDPSKTRAVNLAPISSAI